MVTHEERTWLSFVLQRRNPSFPVPFLPFLFFPLVDAGLIAMAARLLRSLPSRPLLQRARGPVLSARSLQRCAALRSKEGGKDDAPPPPDVDEAVRAAKAAGAGGGSAQAHDAHSLRWGQGREGERDGVMCVVW